MSYKDIEEAQAKRATKKQATASKGKRSSKRKSPMPASGKAKKTWSEVELADDEIAAAGLENHCSILRL